MIWTLDQRNLLEARKLGLRLRLGLVAGLRLGHGIGLMLVARLKLMHGLGLGSGLAAKTSPRAEVRNSRSGSRMSGSQVGGVAFLRGHLVS